LNNIDTPIIISYQIFYHLKTHTPLSRHTNMVRK